MNRRGRAFDRKARAATLLMTPFLLSTFALAENAHPAPTCTPEKVDLTQQGGPLAGSKGLVHDQDSLGVCYANTASLLLNAETPEKEEPISFIDLSLTSSSLSGLSSKTRLIRENSTTKTNEITFEGGYPCEVINAAIERGYACPRSSVPLERHAFENEPIWNTHYSSGSESQKTFLESYGKLIDVLRFAPKDLKQRWFEKVNAAELIRASRELERCDEGSVSTHDLDSFVSLAIQKMMLDQDRISQDLQKKEEEEIALQAQVKMETQKLKDLQQKMILIETRIKETLPFKSDQPITVDSVERKSDGIRSLILGRETRKSLLSQASELENLRAQENAQLLQTSSLEEKVGALTEAKKKLSQDLKERIAFLDQNASTVNSYGMRELSEDFVDQIRASGAYEKALFSQAAEIEKIRKSHGRSGAEVKINETPLGPPLTEFLVSTGMKPEWIDLAHPPIPLSVLSNDLNTADPEVCAREALASILIDPIGGLNACVQSQSPSEDTAIKDLEDALAELGNSLSNTSIPTAELIQALTSEVSLQDFEKTFQSLLASECHVGNQKTPLSPEMGECVQTDFPSNLLGGRPSAPLKSPRTTTQLNPLRNEFQKNVLSPLQSKKPVGLSFCSIALSDPSIDRGNIHCTSGLHGFHAITAVGFRRNADCTVDYLLQNSWGKSSCPLPKVPGANPSEKVNSPDCEEGRLWISEDTLLRNTYGIQSMRDSP